MIKFSLCNKKKYLVALSGGPDSIFLLDLLRKKVNKNNIIACHVNYNYREDSNVDQKICEEYCQTHQIKLLVKEMRVNYSTLNQNFEKWARDIRYDFFNQIMQEYNFDKVLVAHTLNDDIETYLMQLQKKALVRFYGIKKEIKIKDIKVMRPILNYKKSEILNYLAENKIEFALDSTNQNTSFTRNKIRADLNEAELERFLEDKNSKNIFLRKEMLKINKKIQKGIYSTEDFKLNCESSQRLVFEIISKLGLGEQFYSRKKQTIKEIIKQINSQKSYIKIIIEDLFIIKDRTKVYFHKKTKMLKIDKTLKELTVREQEFFKNSVEDDPSDDLWVTNDWEKYKNNLLWEGKCLNEVYKKRKTPYYIRFYLPIIFNKTNKNIINIAFLNDKIKSMS